MQSECVTPLFNKLEQLKLSPSTESTTPDKYMKRKTRSSAECLDQCEKDKNN